MSQNWRGSRFEGGEVNAGSKVAFQDAALELATAGWFVFPCHESDGSRSLAKAPRTPHGHLDATRDPRIIDAWWIRWAIAMIGAPVPEALLVLDIDPRNGGSLETLEALTGPLPATLTTWSGRNDGGRHLYFRRPMALLTGALLPAGIDLKINGYCILPPSLHPATGQPYRWEKHDPALVPSRLRELLRPLPVRPQMTGRRIPRGSCLVHFVERLEPGHRNSGLFWAACRAAEDGVLGQIEAELVLAAVSTGLHESEARRTVASASRTVGAVR